MSSKGWMGVVLVLAVIVGGFYWYAQREAARVAQMPVLAPPELAAVDEADAAGRSAPTIAHPLPASVEPAAPMPSLGESDTAVRQALEPVLGKAPIESFLVPDQLVRRFVATVNSLDEAPIPLERRAFRHVSGLVAVERRGDRYFLSPENGARYDAWITWATAVDTERLVDLYLRYYPLLQAAYVELGYPDRYFNDRLIEVIDHLLETREIAGPIELVRPKVLYQFADPQLERRSSGEKLLIRIGAEHATRVRAKLKAFREALLARAKASG